MRVVIALGGNALLERGERPDAAIQLRHVQAAADALAPLAAEHDLVLCHGNGPQVGLLALESEADRSLSRPYPLDVLGAQTQGMIGYWLAQSLRNSGVAQPVVNLMTQTVVDPADPAFAHPTKYVGAVYDRDDAQRLADLHGWSVAQDGSSWRRVVPSPEPCRVVEQDSILGLLRAGTLVICGGGGGIPVVEDAGRLTGVEAVIDKDLTAALLAIAVGADRLVVLTDVPAIIQSFGTPRATPVSRIGIDLLGRLDFPAGSMAPKVTACRRFVEATGRTAAIGALSDAAAVLAGRSGTTITPGRAGTTDRPRVITSSGGIAPESAP